jgi:hypothetical protein
MFADQQMDHAVIDLGKKNEEYSPTGNSWNQSDLEEEYHKYDPKRYASPRKNQAG